MTNIAPYHLRPTEGAPKGAALWLATQDGLRIRAGYWPALSLAKGTIVILPGRTEYVEKYADLAEDFGRAGWASVAIDWRGQGLCERLTPDPLLGHVNRFTDYQRDLDAVMDWLGSEGERHGLKPPYMLFAHSMGGLIALRALYREHSFKAAVFSAPMWGIRMPLWRSATAAILSRSDISLPQDLTYAPTTAPIAYIAAAPFEGNHLTSDPMRWQRLKQHLNDVPEFALGGPSLRWVREALREARALLALPAPDLPMLAALGGEERIVLPEPIRKRLATWPKGRLDFYPEARHEIAMERDDIRAPFLSRALEFFEAQL